jgi:hypothetical protein
VSRCQRVADATAAADAQSLAALAAHAEACADCAQAQHAHAAYQHLVSGARRALDAEGDLAPEAWVAIRSGIDAATGRPNRWRLAWPVGLATAALGVALVVVAPKFSAPDSRDPAAQLSAPEPAGVLPDRLPASTAPEAVARLGDDAPSPGPGDVLSTADDARTIVAFGRHVLTLSPATAVEVVSWTPSSMIVTVRRGSLSCDVARASAAELFEVRTSQARVRVLGTRFSVTAERDGATAVHVGHGLVEVAHIGGTTRLAEGQADRFGGAPAAKLAPEAQVEPEADGPRDPAARGSASRAVRGHSPQLIDIKVPDQAMEPPAASKRPAPKAGAGGDLKLIEIVVPPQSAPSP